MPPWAKPVCLTAAAQGLRDGKLSDENLNLPFALWRRLGFVVKIQADFADPRSGVTRQYGFQTGKILFRNAV